MFRLFLLVYTAAILLSPKALAAESSRYLCFSRDQDIWIANLNGAGAHKIVAGNDPAISPDGARVAYTEPGKGSNRHIALIEIASGKKAVFRNLPSDNAYGPIWSPNGQRLRLWSLQ